MTAVLHPPYSAIRGLSVLGRGLPEQEGLVGWFPLKEGNGNRVYDLSGYGLSGAMTGMSAVTDWGIGNASGIGRELNFNGSTAYIEMDHNPPQLEPPKNLTVMAWCKANNTTQNNIGIVMKRWSEGTNPWNSYTIHGANGAPLKYAWGISSGVFGSWTAISGPNATTNWTHVTGTYDGANLRIYYDGVEKTVSGSVTLTIGYSTTPLRLGTAQSDGFRFNGRISDVRIFDRALSPEEIYEAYARTVGIIAKPRQRMAVAAAAAPPSGFVGYMPLTGVGR